MRTYLRIFLMPFVGMLLPALIPASKADAQTATITTDQADYMSGSTIYITQSGFTTNTTKITLI